MKNKSELPYDEAQKKGVRLRVSIKQFNLPAEGGILTSKAKLYINDSTKRVKMLIQRLALLVAALVADEVCLTV